ncbi:MAG TPA: phospholipase D family protein [Cyclobacteriaceae bacterium]|nr:phospholipase D family protein [Cyclobacteriaceae bacterium]
MKLIFLPAIVLWMACSSAEQKYQPITIDFCADIKPVAPLRLSEQLDPIADSLLSKTTVYSLEEGDEAMIYRAWLCASAEKTIDVQYFIFSSDNVGLIAVDYLLRAADRGVQVRVIVDDIMVEADADELLALDSHPNLSIRIYNPNANTGKNIPRKLWNMTTHFRDFNQRMHNKTFIVDGQAVITGGRNIADEYFDYDHAFNFRDRDVLLIGRTAQDVQRSFNQFWDSPLSVPVNGIVDEAYYQLNTKTKFEWLHQYACNPDNFWPQVRERIDAMPETFKNMQEDKRLVWVDSISFVSDEPGKNSGTDGLGGGGRSTKALIDLVNSANESIQIQSPYLISTEVSQNLFRSAIARGVEIHILTNSLSSTDNLEAFSGYQRERDALLKMGVHIYEFKPNAAVRFKIMSGALQRVMNFTPVFGLHAKSMVVDNKIAVIGTFNLDPRSANLNTECVTVIRDSTIARRLAAAMEEDRKPENAWETTLSSNPDEFAGWQKRTKTWFRRLVPKAIL